MELADESNPMTESGSQPDLSNVEYRLAWLTRLLGIGVLTLVGVTWKLWTPQDVFPRVPLFRWAPPDWWDWTSLGLIVIGGLGLGIAPTRFTRLFATTLAAGLVIAFLCDQHRLQPWAWQFLILALLITLADKPLQWHGWQWLTISIYFYSALSKFDEQFYWYAGIQLENFVGSRLFPRGIPNWFLGFFDQMTGQRLAQLCPIGEMVIAGLLVFHRGRNLGVALAVIMHMVLILVLGPYGLRHSQGVLLWNLWFAAQTIDLFGGNWLERLLKPQPMELQPVSMLAPKQIMGSPWGNTARYTARLLLIFVLAWPATRPWGLCDLWIGWAVYVPLKDEIDIQVYKDSIHEKLPQFSPPVWWMTMDEFAFYHPDVGEWSLVSLSVPEYPHARCRLAAALDLAIHSEIDEIRVFVTPSSRWTESRWIANQDGVLNGVDGIKSYCKRFWFNAYPTSMYRRAAKEKVMNDDG